jgi:hypothetical protein
MKKQLLFACISVIALQSCKKAVPGFNPVGVWEGRRLDQ